jgi:hypothetical protein
MEERGVFQAGYVGGDLRTYPGLVATLAESSRQGDKLPESYKAYGDSPPSAGFHFAEATKARKLLKAMAEAAKRLPVQVRSLTPQKSRTWKSLKSCYLNPD